MLYGNCKIIWQLKWMLWYIVRFEFEMRFGSMSCMATTLVSHRNWDQAAEPDITQDIAFLTHWGRDKMAAISQTTHTNAFSWIKMLEIWLIFHWSLFLMVKSTILHHWFWKWLGADQATSHYLNQWCIYASLGLNELTHCGLVTQCDIIDPGHHWFRSWFDHFDAIRHQAITWANLNLSSVKTSSTYFIDFILSKFNRFH